MKNSILNNDLVLVAVRRLGAATTAEIAAETGLASNLISAHLARLLRVDEVERSYAPGRDRRRAGFVYRCSRTMASSEAIAEAVLAALPEQGATVADLRTSTGFSAVSVWRALSRLRKAGRVQRRKGEKLGPGPKPDVWKSKGGNGAAPCP